MSTGGSVSYSVILNNTYSSAVTITQFHDMLAASSTFNVENGISINGVAVPSAYIVLSGNNITMYP